MFFVYILRTNLGTLYIGQTSDLERRLKDHAGSAKSAKYLRYFSSFELVYSEPQPTRGDAMRREWELKKLTRAKKLALIESRVSVGLR